MTSLRQRVLDELQRRNYSQTTVTGYIKTVADFAKYFQRPPDQLGSDEIRQYQLYLLKERKQGVRTVGNHTAALRFFFCKTLKRNYPVEEVPYPRAPRRLPIILTQEEAVRLVRHDLVEARLRRNHRHPSPGLNQQAEDVALVAIIDRDDVGTPTPPTACGRGLGGGCVVCGFVRRAHPFAASRLFPSRKR